MFGKYIRFKFHRHSTVALAASITQNIGYFITMHYASYQNSVLILHRPMQKRNKQLVYCHAVLALSVMHKKKYWYL